MSIHYKFKSNLNFDTLTFDGVQISVGDLKKSIMKQKKLGKITDFELQVTNAQTKEVYTSDNALIPKNTSLIISRVPTNNTSKKTFENPSDALPTKLESKIDGGNLDLTQLKASEEEKIQAMMMQSTADYDPKSYYKLKSQSQVGEVPPTYKCNKCKKGGHWIKNCPFINFKEINEIKRNTGIPMSFREKKAITGDSILFTEQLSQKRSVPDDLICGICKDLFVDAVMIPCCGSSFCDDCVRTALLESDENECPDCKEKGSSPASLIPNRFLRNSVNAFRNENGFTSEISIQSLKKSEHKTEENSMETFEDGNKKIDLNRSTDKDLDTIQSEAVPVVENELKTIEAVEKPQQSEITKKSLSEDPRPLLSEPNCEKKASDECSFQVMPNHDVSNKCLDKHFSETKADKIKHVDTKMETNKHQRETVAHQQIQIPISICEPTTFKPMRPFNQFTPLQPQLLNAFENMYNRIQPSIGSIPFLPTIRPRMEPIQQEFYQPNPHIVDSKKSHCNIGLNPMYSHVRHSLGNGIIDDPLEAFNRIMEEKEKRRSKQRRSRSKDRSKRWYRRSPSYDRRSRRHSVSPEKKLSKIEYHGKNNNRENYSISSNRHRRSMSKSSRSRSKSQNRQYSRSPKLKRTAERRKNEISERMSRNERQRHYKGDISKIERKNDFMRQPSPPGSENKYSSQLRFSRSRSISPYNPKRYKKKSPDSKKDDPYLKQKTQSQSINSDYKHAEILENKMQSVREKSSSLEKKANFLCNIESSNANISNEETQKDFSILEKKVTDPDSLKLEDESTIKESFKKEKKSKERKKKKKEKAEKVIKNDKVDKNDRGEKKKNKKIRKEKKSRKSSEKFGAVGNNKDLSGQKNVHESSQKMSNGDEGLTPPNLGSLKSIMEGQKVSDDSDVINSHESLILMKERHKCYQSNIEKISKSEKELDLERYKSIEETKLKSFVEMPQNSVNHRSNIAKDQSKFRKNCLAKRYDVESHVLSKDLFKKEPQSHQININKDRREHVREDNFKGSRKQSDQSKLYKSTENFEVKSVASRLNWNPRTDNPFRRNRVNDKFERHMLRGRLNSATLSSASDAFSGTEENRMRLKNNRKINEKKHTYYSSSEESIDSLKRKVLKSKKKHKTLKKKKKRE